MIMHAAARLALVTLFVTATMPIAAQPQGVAGEIARDLGQVKEKIMGLAKAMPASSWDWRPGKAARSTGEVFAHIAADNYFLPAMMGATPPAATGINGKEYKTAEAFEKKKMTREETLAELEKSFAFLEQSLKGQDDAKLGAPLEAFGQKTTHRGMWISTATHLHEHLGQLIAYARSNNITPPWSK
jgi:uncharacterized damage-inducible protein DinB